MENQERYETWDSMTPAEAEALAAGMQAAEERQEKALQARCDAFYALGYGEVEKARKILLGAVNPKEACTYCGGEGGEPAGLDYYVPCPMCGDTGKEPI